MRRVGLLPIVVLSLAAGRVDAQRLGAAVRVGSAGVGAELTAALAEPLNLRVGGSWFQLDRDFTRRGITFEGQGKLAFGAALLDLHPGGGLFRLSAGAVYNRTRAIGDSVGGTVVLDGVPYDVRLVGRLHGEAKGREFAPYAGIGWGDAARSRSRVGFIADAGVIFWGRPAVTLDAAPTNPALVPAGFYERLEAERKGLEDDLEKYRFFPVLSVGLSVRF